MKSSHLIKPTFWKEIYEKGGVSLIKTKEAESHFLSSRMMNGTHRLLLDIDRQIEYGTKSITLTGLNNEKSKLNYLDCKKLDLDLKRAGLGALNREGIALGRLILHFSYPVSVYPSSTLGHFHLVLDLPDNLLMEWQTFQTLLEGFQKVGLI